MTSEQSTGKQIRIGGATGYWGEADMALPQFLAEGNLDYIVFDYLAEVTMSILARARASDPSLGYATDFVTGVIKPHLADIAKAGIKLISNAGGVNPEACAVAIRKIADDQGLDLRVAVVLGDDLSGDLEAVGALGVTEMFSGEPLPTSHQIASANVYLGAFPIAEALTQGADIVITGRCVDSAVTLGACIHQFGWAPDQLDLLAAGSLAGHLIECGPQATGGNFTDWDAVAETLHRVGYPIAEIDSTGAIIISKPSNTGGMVSVGTVGEQLLYEIADPGNYYLPDVICDFTRVELSSAGDDKVRVSGAKGRGVPDHYKASITWADGWRAGGIYFYVGENAPRKARIFADEGIQRATRKLERLGAPAYDEICVEVVGDESHWGAPEREAYREVAVKVACKHQDKQAVALLLKELSGAALGAPPGLCLFSGTRPRPSPVIRLFSCLIPKSRVAISLKDRDDVTEVQVRLDGVEPSAVPEPEVPTVDGQGVPDMVTVPLENLAWARSGDKGDSANVGVMARRADYLPWIARGLTSAYVADRFAHFMSEPRVDRYFLPGISALNFVLHNVLGGGGVASLRNDPQAKCYAQVLLDAPITLPASLIGE